MTAIDNLGFHRTRLDERLATLETAVRAIFGSDIDLAPETVDGQLLGVFAEAISDLDQLAEDVYNGRSPAGAYGAGLARLVQLNGITKLPESFSLATVTLTGTTGTFIPAGALIAASNDSTAVFATLADVTLAGGTGTAVVRATVAGPVRAAAGTLTVIKTVINGWTVANNLADATLGAFGETDTQLRIRRAASVASPSQSVVDGLFAALSQVANVTSVSVYENPTGLTDAHGLPPHSINVVIAGGLDADIASVIWLKRSAGVTMMGTSVVNVTDAQGFAQTQRFDRPVDASVYVIVNLSSAPGALAEAAIKAVLVAFGTPSKIGADVVWAKLFAPVNAVLPAGVYVKNIFLGSAPAPTLQQNLTVAVNAAAVWDATRISVVSF